jgi:hypothetical protein
MVQAGFGRPAGGLRPGRAGRAVQGRDPLGVRWPPRRGGVGRCGCLPAYPPGRSRPCGGYSAVADFFRTQGRVGCGGRGAFCKPVPAARYSAERSDGWIFGERCFSGGFGRIQIGFLRRIRAKAGEAALSIRDTDVRPLARNQMLNRIQRAWTVRPSINASID